MFRLSSTASPLATSAASSVPLNPTGAALAVAFQLAPQPFSDAQLCGVPEAIYLTVEVFRELG